MFVFLWIYFTKIQFLSYNKINKAKNKRGIFEVMLLILFIFLVSNNNN